MLGFKKFRHTTHKHRHISVFKQFDEMTVNVLTLILLEHLFM